LRELSEYIKGYLAGIIDGEACISLYKVKYKGTPRGFTWRSSVQISNTNLELIEAIKDICGGGNIVTTEDKRGIWNRKTIHVYNMPVKVQREITPQLILIVKKRHKELLLEALSILRQGGHRLTYDEERRLEEIYQEFKVLNKRGGLKRLLE
jgi:hypothetical protein